MSQPVLIRGLGEIADRYDAVLCDVWGVIHNGAVSFPAAVDALTRFQAERGPVTLISNAPRPSADVVAQLEALSVPASAWAGFVTSGDVTRDELAARAPGPAWDVGPDRDGTLYKGLGLAFAGPEEAAFISCTGLVDDEIETPEDYRERLAIAAARGITMICANPDRVVQRGPRLIYCAGALADLYTAMGGPVVMAGKPYPPIYARTLTEAERLSKRPLDPARVLCIGDGVQTDVTGAMKAGLDCLLVTSGIHSAEINGADGHPDGMKLDSFLGGYGVHAAWAMADLVWSN